MSYCRVFLFVCLQKQTRACVCVCVCVCARGVSSVLEQDEISGNGGDVDQDLSRCDPSGNIDTLCNTAPHRSQINEAIDHPSDPDGFGKKYWGRFERENTRLCACGKLFIGHLCNLVTRAQQKIRFTYLIFFFLRLG